MTNNQVNNSHKEDKIMSFVSRFFVRFSYFIHKIVHLDLAPVDLKRALKLNTITHTYNLRSDRTKDFHVVRSNNKFGDKEFDS